MGDGEKVGGVGGDSAVLTVGRSICSPLISTGGTIVRQRRQGLVTISLAILAILPPLTRHSRRGTAAAKRMPYV